MPVMSSTAAVRAKRRSQRDARSSRRTSANTAPRSACGAPGVCNNASCCSRLSSGSSFMSLPTHIEKNQLEWPRKGAKHREKYVPPLIEIPEIGRFRLHSALLCLFVPFVATCSLTFQIGSLTFGSEHLRPVRLRLTALGHVIRFYFVCFSNHARNDLSARR